MSVPVIFLACTSILITQSAGVLGLSSALSLLDNLPHSKYNILLVSDYFSVDGPDPSYPTTAAGAHYRPIPATSPQLEYEARLANVTFSRFKSLAAANPELGVQFMEGMDWVSGEAAPSYKALLPDYASLEDFRVLSENEKPAHVDFGARYTTYTVDPEVYMMHLLRRFKLRGGHVRRMRLKFLQDAFNIDGFTVRTVVNCSGYGFGDPNSYIIRGVTYIHIPFNCSFVWSYVFQRKDYTYYTFFSLTLLLWYRANLSGIKPL